MRVRTSRGFFCPVLYSVVAKQWSGVSSATLSTPLASHLGLQRHGVEVEAPSERLVLDAAGEDLPRLMIGGIHYWWCPDVTNQARSSTFFLNLLHFILLFEPITALWHSNRRARWIFIFDAKLCFPYSWPLLFLFCSFICGSFFSPLI